MPGIPKTFRHPRGHRVFNRALDVATPKEKAVEGKHFKSLRSNLSKAKTEAVLSVLDGSPILDTLAKHPIQEIEFLRTPERGWNGAYDHEARTIQINTIRRWGNGFGEAFVPGKSFSIASATGDKLESMRRSLLQETAHHMQEVGGKAVSDIARAAFNNAARRPITRYAERPWFEYLAESWSACNVEREALRSYDPVGYKMVEDVLAVLRKQAK